MSDSPYYLDVVSGNAPSNAQVVHKFGRNSAVGTSYVPVTLGGVYQTPMVSGATQLRVKIGDTNDTAAGTGARSIYIEGLNALGALVSEVIPTAGLASGAASVNSYIRLYRAYVYTSGTYATASAGSHAANIVIENAAGGTTWATIDSTGFPRGQTEMAAYTVPLGKTAYIMSFHVSVDSSKTTDVLFFQRPGVLETAAPYQAMRKVFGITGISLTQEFKFDIPQGPFLAGTDLGVLAKVSSTTANVVVSFEILLKDRE